MNMAEAMKFPPKVEPTFKPTLRGELKLNEPMMKYVSWRVGGQAQRVYKPADLADLQTFLPTIAVDEPILFVGLGSNLLVRGHGDVGGFAGTVIITTPVLSGLVIDAADATIVKAGAGVPSPHVAKFAAKNHLAAAEWLAGVPGTVGGALAMNAGCYGTETWDQIESATTIDRAGVLHTRTKVDFDIGYRHVAALCEAEEWFVSARFRFVPGDAAVAQARIKELLAQRMASQPLDKPNAGSTFRNPPNDHAARLIESCGLKGFTMGGAQVSTKHANFIINLGHATANDIESMIAHMHDTVMARTGIGLVREVKIVGKHE